MGTMVHIVEGTHHTYKNFFTQEECDHIISIFERDKDIIPYGTDTGYEGLTSTYSEYNWLYNKDIQPLNIPQRLFDLDYFSDWEYMVVQCWGNALHVGEELKEHYHGEIMEEHYRRMYFNNCNIFSLKSLSIDKPAKINLDCTVVLSKNDNPKRPVK